MSIALSYAATASEMRSEIDPRIRRQGRYAASRHICYTRSLNAMTLFDVAQGRPRGSGLERLVTIRA